jgi:hypothetical protein
MRQFQRLLSVASVVVLFLLTGFSQNPSSSAGVQTIPVDQIRPGMQGIAYTVFQGTQPEPMEFEVLGVLRNLNGPKANIILVRLHGKKVEYTGVVAGMSGSPAYIDGKLAGALAFRIGEFSKEPIAGITPIGDMLEINALDKSPGSETPVSKSAFSASAKTSGPGLPPDSLTDFASALKPIDTPLVFSGFTEEAIRLFAPQFSAAGILPVMGAGSVSGVKQPEPLVPGSAVSALLVRGDMDIAATCTVTYIDPTRLLACGHPLMQFGSTDLPMSKATVLATLPSPANAFKIVDTTEPAGVFVQDRHSGIMGVFDHDAKMIPVQLTIHSKTNSGAVGDKVVDKVNDKVFHYEVLSNPRISPLAMMATTFNALRGLNEYGEEVSYQMNGRITINGYPDVGLKSLFSPSDGGRPAAIQAALAVGDRFGRIYDNPFSAADVHAVELEFNLVPERRSAVLEAAHADLTEVRPGQEIVVEAVVRPYRGDRVLLRIPVRVPTSVAPGPLRIVVSDGDTLDRMRRGPFTFGQRLDLASTIAQLNQEHSSNRIYVSLLESEPEARIADKIMPSLPLSVMNVMDGMRSTQEMSVQGESAVGEASAELDYVVSGTQVLTVTVK